MKHALIIGAGGVGAVVAHKCAQASDVFSRITLASRTKSKCDRIADRVRETMGVYVDTEAVDADDVAQTSSLIQRLQPDILINVALPYQDLPLMDACLATKTDYLDTANYEPPDEARFEYSHQWKYHDRYRDAGVMALLGSGFDPGVTNVFCAYAQKHLFDRIRTIDIVDCNAGSHGHPFATNFNPEINIREITQRGKYWEAGQWREIDAMSVSQEFDFPGVGPRKMYLIYHEEEESLVRHIPGLERIRFWMTFGEEYLTHLRVLQNVGMTRIDEVEFEGQRIVPLKFLKAVLPDPASLGQNYQGKTCIGCVIEGERDGQSKRVFIYNICDHAVCYQETGAQAVSFTTGVPAMIGGQLVATGQWRQPGVFNMEQLDPDPFMELLPKYGLPWEVVDWPSAV